MKRLSKDATKGFTLIELIVVIVILGILAATAMPKFIELSEDARISATKGVAGAISSATALNAANCFITGGKVLEGKCRALNSLTACVGMYYPHYVSGATPASNGTLILGSVIYDITASGNSASCGKTPTPPETNPVDSVDCAIKDRRAKATTPAHVFTIYCARAD